MELIFLDLAVANFVKLLMSLRENRVFEPFKWEMSANVEPDIRKAEGMYAKDPSKCKKANPP